MTATATTKVKTMTTENSVRTSWASPEFAAYLQARRSCPIALLGGPGPDRTQIETILRSAMRAPDHGLLYPWHFIVFKSEARRKIGDALKAAWLIEEPDSSPAKLELESERFLRAPVVIAVVSTIREGKKRLWDQVLSAGAVCLNLSLAAQAQGFATNWVTEWCAYSRAFKTSLGLKPNDHIAGFIYIGTPTQQPEERDRPDPARLVTWWGETKLNAGEGYGHPGKGYPEAGFAFDFSE